MARPEEGEEVGVGADLRVELDPDHLDVVRLPGADQLVGRVGHVALRVPDLGLHDAHHPLERQLHPPEAARPELRELVAGAAGSIEVRV